MPENKEDKYCLVRSFRMYTSHLHPENNYMWQTPNLCPKDSTSNIWYTKGHLGKTPLGNFITDLCDTPTIVYMYAVPTSLPNLVNLIPKRLWTLQAINQCKASLFTREYNQKKMEMGKLLNSKLSATAMKPNDQEEQQNSVQQVISNQILAQNITPVPTPPPPAIPENAQIVPYELQWDDTSDFDLLTMLAELENDQKVAQVTPKLTTLMSTVSNQLMQQRNSLMFSGCQIGNITINITKK